MTEPAAGSDAAPASRARWTWRPACASRRRADLALLDVGRAGRPACQHVEHAGRGPLRRGRVAEPARRGPGTGSWRAAGAGRHGGRQRRALAGPQPGARPGPLWLPGWPGAGGGPAPEADPAHPGLAAPAGGGQAPAGRSASGSGVRPMSTTADPTTASLRRLSPTRRAGQAGRLRQAPVRPDRGCPSTRRVVATSRSIWATRSPTESKRTWPRRWATNSTRAASP